jgi:heme O synthase-like polyprenyltransferase
MSRGLMYTYMLVIVVGAIALMFSGNAEAAWLGAFAIVVAVGLGVLAWKRRN